MATKSSRLQNVQSPVGPPGATDSDTTLVLGERHASTSSTIWRWAPRLLILTVLLAIVLLAARPLFMPRLIHGADSLPHYYSLVQLDDLVDQGVIYSRWFPTKYSGFGAPFFQYYAPLAFYAAEAIARLGLELLSALRLAWGLTLLGAALGMYLWARDLFDRGPALVAAAAYVFGPYLLYTAYFRAGYPEQFGLMFMPLALWSFRRLARRAQARYLLLAAATYAGLHLSHTLTALIFSAFLVAYTLLLALDPAGLRLRWRVLARLWAAIGLGLGVSAFFWLPAFWEQGALKSELATASPAVNYRTHFVSFRRLFSGPLASLPTQALSLVAVLLAGVGLAATDRRTGVVGCNRREVWLATLGAVLSAFMALSYSSWLWQALPPLQIFQFPFRFLGLTTLFLAFLAAAGTQVIQDAIRRRNARLGQVATVVLPLLILILLAIPSRSLSQVKTYKALPDIDVEFIMARERDAAPFLGEFIGAYIPATVQKPPPLEQQKLDGPERLDLDSLPPGAQVAEASYGPLRYDLTLSSPEAFIATFRTFYFPGWSAELDGNTISISIIDPYGKIGVEIPPGEHDLVVRFGSTSVRTVATALSWSSVLVLGCALVLGCIVVRRSSQEAPMT